MQSLTVPTLVAVISMVSIACGGAQSAPVASVPGGPKTDRLVMALPGPSEESNETRHLNQPQVWQLRPMFEYVLGMDAKTGKMIPELATEWKLEPDGQSFRFKLRQGVKFHNDTGEFTAADIKFTWEDFTQDDSAHGQAIQFKKGVARIEVVSDYEAVIQLTEPDGNFLHALGEAEGGMEVVGKASAAKQGAPSLQAQPYAGTGPYQYVGRQQGTHVRYKRVPYQHWKTTPDFNEFEFRFIKEGSTRLAGLLTGELHLATLPEDLMIEATKQGMKTLRGQVPGLRTFMRAHCCNYLDPKDPSKGMKYPDSPLWDVRVRRALNKAINRDELNKAFFGGKGENIINNHFHPTRPGWNPDWEKRYQDEYGFDQAKARALLAEAGYSAAKPLETNIFPTSLPQYAGAEDVAESIAGYWRSVGVKVNLTPMDQAEYERQRRGDLFQNLYALVGTSSDLFIAQVYTGLAGGRSLTGSKVVDPKVDALVDTVYKTLDEERQDRIWRQVGDAIFPLHQTINLFWLPAEIMVNPKYVDDWVFPGAITGTWTHVQNIKATR